MSTKGKKTLKTEQSKLIGEHPSHPSIFYSWCANEDMPVSKTQLHRKLSEISMDNDLLIDQLSEWIVKHHVKPTTLTRLEKKKSILEKHEFREYVEKRKYFPIKNRTTQKGNLGEIILAEYLTETSELELFIYKLHFNPNVEQSMKGDDILLFDKKNINNKMIIGEAKFRQTSTKKVVEDAIKGLNEDMLPLSMSFVSERLYELGEDDLADQIDNLISNIHLKKTPVVYVAFLISDHLTYKRVEDHLNSTNKNLVFISLGLNNPNEVVEKSFDNVIKKFPEYYL